MSIEHGFIFLCAGGGLFLSLMEWIATREDRADLEQEQARRQKYQDRGLRRDGGRE